MAQRSAARQSAAKADFDEYIRQTATASGGGGGGGSSPVDDLHRLATLRDNGTITDEEFEAMKARVVSG